MFFVIRQSLSLSLCSFDDIRLPVYLLFESPNILGTYPFHLQARELYLIFKNKSYEFEELFTTTLRDRLTDKRRMMRECLCVWIPHECVSGNES